MAAPRDDGRASAREPMLREGQRSTECSEFREAATSSTANGATPAPPSAVPSVSFHELFRYATPADKLLLAIATIGAIVQGVTGPALSFFMKDLFQAIYLPNDNGSEPPHATGDHHNRDQKVLDNLYIFLVMALVAFVSSGLSYLGFARVGDSMAFKLRQRFFDELLQKHVGWYDLNRSAEMATRLTNDTYDFRQGVGEKLAQLIMGLVMSPAGFVVAFTHDWRLTLMMLGAIPFMAGGFGVAMKTLQKSASAQQEFYASAGGLAETTISSIRTVAAFGGYEREIAKYDEKLAAAEANGIRAGWCNGLSIGFSQIAIYGTFALGFWAGSLLVVHDYDRDCWKSNPPFGDCFTGSTMLSTLFAVLYGGIGLGQAAPGMASLSAAKAAAGRIYKVVDEPLAFDAEEGTKLEKVEGLVEFRDVTFSYPSRPDALALERTSFAVLAGQTAAFVGPSGSGKSTTISLLQRFYDPTSGTICVDGVDIRTLSLNWLRTKMALVQQEPVLFSGTIFENIAYGAPWTASSQAVEAAAKSANAHSFIMAFPAGYKTEVGERGAQLSGGQKQRIAIARAIIRDPAILLLDEATSALDTESERVVQKALDELMAQKARTTLVIAHRLSTVKEAHCIFVLENGKLLEKGTHKELMATKGSLYAQLVELQEVTGDADLDATTEFGAKRQLSNGSSTGSASGRFARQSSGGGPPERTLSRQRSTEGTPFLDIGRSATVPVAEAPPEDDEDVDVPTSRLWAMQKPDMAFVILALLCTVPVGAGRPLMGFLFSDTSNLFSKPPAVLINGQWVGVLDREALRSQANVQCLTFALLGCVLFVGTAGQLGGFRRTAEALTRRLRLRTFKAMLRQEIAWFDARTSGHLADRLATEAPLIKSYTGESLAAVIQLFFCLGSGLVIAVWASWRLTLCSLIFFPILMLGSLAMVRAMRKRNETTAGPMVSEAMGNIRTVSAFGLREKMMQRYLKLLQVEGGEERRKSTSTGFASAYNSGVSFIMFGGVVYLANIFVNHSWIEPGDVLQVLFPVMFAASGAAFASQWQADKTEARKALNHIFHTLDRTPVIDAYAETGERLQKVLGEIEFRHVAFRYPTRPDVVVFENFDLKIAPSTTVAFCGPSGSGKSTTIALLQRFYNPTSGSVCLDGHDISTLNLAWLRKQMALVQQEPVLFAGTVLENIRYGREDATDAECMEAAKSANAHGFISGFEAGYDTQVGERGSQLSGGQKQRVAIARSMVRDPAVLLLDEATSALDTESERVVQEALDALLAQSRRTTLVIAHRLSTIVNSDMICVIFQGKIVEKGTHSELMRLPDGQYKQLAARQQIGS